MLFGVWIYMNDKFSFKIVCVIVNYYKFVICMQCCENYLFCVIFFLERYRDFEKGK